MSESVAASGTESADTESAPTLRRTLGRYQVLIYGLGSMLGAGIYALIDDVARLLGSMVWAAFATAMVGALLTGLTYASLGSRYAKAGGAAYITGRACRSPLISYVVGLAVMMSGLTSMATGTQAMGETLIKASQERSGTFQPATGPGTVDSAKASPWVKPLAIGVVALLGLILLKGIRESMWANLICTAVEAGGLLFIIAVGMQFWGSRSLFDLPDPPAAVQVSQVVAAPVPSPAAAPAATPDSAMPIFMLLLNGALLTFFSFIGFEDILNVSEECKHPRVDVPFGLIGAMLMATVIYIAVAITAVSVIPHEQLAGSSSPLMDVARAAAPWFTGIGGIYLVVTLFAIGNTALLNYLMGSRLLYGMSRQGLLPAPLGRVSAKTRTPVVAIGVLLVIVSLLILLANVAQLAKATVLLLLGVFVLMNVALVILKRRPEEKRGGFEIPTIIPVLGAIVCTALIVAELARPFRKRGGPEWNDFTSVFIALGVVAAAAVLYAILRPDPAVMTEDRADAA
jgi:amino acid transporter